MEANDAKSPPNLSLVGGQLKYRRMYEYQIIIQVKKFQITTRASPPYQFRGYCWLLPFRKNRNKYFLSVQDSKHFFTRQLQLKVNISLQSSRICSKRAAKWFCDLASHIRRNLIIVRRNIFFTKIIDTTVHVKSQ